MAAIFKFMSRNYLDRLPEEDRKMIARNAAAATERLKKRGNDAPSEVQVIRLRRRAAADQHAATI